MFRYSVAIKWSDEDKGFIASVPELEGLTGFGESQDKAVRELLAAAELYMATLKASGEAIPEPNKFASYSGQLRLRLPKSLHANLATEAETEGVSLNTYLVSLLSNRHIEREMIHGLIEEMKELFQVSPYKVEGRKGTRTTTVGKAEDQSSPAALTVIAGGKH